MSIIYSINKARIAWSGAGEDVVLLDLQASTYLAVNPAAAVLWHTLAGAASEPAELSDALLVAFPALDIEDATNDVADFLEDLVGRGFVLRGDGTAASGSDG